MAILRIKNPDTGLWEEIVAIQGDSAYETALKHGFEGTEQEWLESLIGKTGETPKWKLLREITIPNTPAEGMDGVAYGNAPYEGRILCAFNTDRDGNPFSCTEFFVMVYGPATVPSGCGDLWAPSVALANSNNPLYEVNVANGKTYHSIGINVGNIHENSELPYISGYGMLSILSNNTAYSIGSKIFDSSAVSMQHNAMVESDFTTVRPWESVAIGIATSEWHNGIDGTVHGEHTFGFMPGTTIRVWGR